MAIYTITFQNTGRDSYGNPTVTTLAKISGPVKLRTSSYKAPIITPDEYGVIDCSLAAADTVAITATETGDGMKAARDSLITYYDSNPFVSSLNGEDPTSDGRMFLTGSECVSITPVMPGKSMLTVVDLCKACTGACSTFINVRKWLEYYTIALNMLKDTNLYTNDVAVGRFNWIKGNNRLEVNDTCKAELDTMYEDKLKLQAYELLYQYTMLVQMWNYAVSMSRSETAIESAPEEPTGFVVNTKFGVTNCTKITGTATAAKKLRCIISIRHDKDSMQSYAQPSYALYYVDEARTETEINSADAPISLLVKPTNIVCKPFGQDTQIEPEDVDVQIVNETTSRGLDKDVIFETEVYHAGTYEVKLKLLTFISVGFAYSYPIYGRYGYITCDPETLETLSSTKISADAYSMGTPKYPEKGKSYYYYDYWGGHFFYYSGKYNFAKISEYERVLWGGNATCLGTGKNIRVIPVYRIIGNPTDADYNSFRLFASSGTIYNDDGTVETPTGNRFEVTVKWMLGDNSASEEAFANSATVQTETFTYITEPCMDFQTARYPYIYQFDRVKTIPNPEYYPPDPDA